MAPMSVNLRGATLGRTIGQRQPTEPRKKEMLGHNCCPARGSAIKSWALGPIRKALRKTCIYNTGSRYGKSSCQVLSRKSGVWT
jgi:hypothetical protein